jgi:membrane-associated phospholipid phosphatase
MIFADFRVYLGYHTVLQVLVGSIVGIITAFAWYHIIQRYTLVLTQSILNNPIGRMLSLNSDSLKVK